MGRNANHIGMWEKKTELQKIVSYITSSYCEICMHILLMCLLVVIFIHECLVLIAVVVFVYIDFFAKSLE